MHLAKAAFLLAALTTSGCSLFEPERFEFESDHMGTTFRIVLYAHDRATATLAAEGAFRRIEELNAVCSDYLPLSEVNRLTALSKERIPTEWRLLSDDLYAVLERGDAWRRFSDGAFDVTIGPFTQLWRRAKRQQELPAPERLAAATAAFGGEFLELDPQTRAARLTKRDMKIDLGGIAVGYALDDALARLRAQGLSRVLIDGGGDVIVGDPPPGEDGWKIVLDPQLASDGSDRSVVLLRNASVTTSGGTSKYVEIGGARYSHIVDPKTGLGLTRPIAACAIGKRAIDADAFATIACLVGPERALQLARENGLEVRVVTLDETRFPVIDDSPGLATLLYHVDPTSIPRP